VNSTDLLIEVNQLLVGTNEIQKALMAIWNRIDPGEDLPKGLKPIKRRKSNE